MSADELREERLLELLIDGADERAIEAWARAAGVPPPAPSVEADELRAFLATCREACAPEALEVPEVPDVQGAPSERYERLAERVLARTTREDLSWRGDLRLVGAFLRERLRSSRALRLAAASLVVHLLALPAIAWYVLSAPWKEEPRIFFQPAPAVVGELGTDPGEEPALEAPPDAFGEGERGADPFEVENALRRARFLLARDGVPAVPPRSADAPEPGLEIRLLRARSAGVHAGQWDEILDDAALARSVDGLARVLLGEALLDRYALESGDGSRSDRFAADAAQLRALAAREGDAAGGSAALRSLEADLRERLAAYGLGGFGPAGGAPDRRGRRDRPVDAAWLERLGRVLGERGLAGPEVDAWVGWRHPDGAR